MVQAPDPTPRPLDHLPALGAPGAPALVLKAEVLDFAALEERVGRLAGLLKARGLAPDDRVASWLSKSEAACLLPLAAARAGFIHVPVNPVLKRAQAAHILSDSGARLLVSGAGRLASLAPGDVPADCATLDEAAIDLAAADPLPPSAADPDALAALLYTSGSTGRPKGVMLTHANLWLGAASVAHYLGLAPTDRVLAVLPLSFDYGQSQLLSAWAAGAAAIPLDYLAPADLVRAAGRHDVTVLAGVPPLWVQLAEADWPSGTAGRLRILTNSGGALSPPLVKRLRALFPRARLFAMYGLTEAFRSTFLDPALIDAHPTSIGRAVPFADISVRRPDGSETADGEAGELVHAGPLVARGYWRDPKRTAARFRSAPSGEGPAVWSGDTVRRDEDGLLHFVGRDDAMIKTAGNRVSPTEIEEAAIASGLAGEAVAFGTPDPRLGAAIVLAVRGDAAGAAALGDHLRRELPSYMQPRAIVWRKDFPRNPNGKLDRVAIIREVGAQLDG